MKKYAIAITVIAICLISVHVQAQPQEVRPLKIFSELSETDREFPEMNCDRRYNNCRAFEVKNGVLYIYGHGHLWTRDPAYNLTRAAKIVVEVTARLHISKEGKHKGHCSGLIIGFASNLDRWRADSESDALTFTIGCSENANFHTAVRTGMYRKFIGTSNFILPPDRWQKVKIVLSTENLQAFVEGEEVINVDLAKVDFPKTGYVGILGFGYLRSEIQYLKINGHRAVPDSREVRAGEIMPASSGTGFAVSRDGYVVTNRHVIDGCNRVAVHHDGRTIPAVIVSTDPVNDIALLKVEFKPSFSFPLSNTRPQLMQEIFVAGYPFGRQISSSVKITKGIISALTGVGNNSSNVQIDAALQPGNSGGPIFDAKGNVVAVAVAKLDLKNAFKAFGTIPENTNFGIKANVIANLLASNHIAFRSHTTKSISKAELARKVSNATYYVSCWITRAQIRKMKARKVIFSDVAE